MKSKICRSLLLMSSIFGSAVAHAQTAPNAATAAPGNMASDQGDTTGDIIVTAQKRSERLTDVPLSITAASGEQLRARGIVDPTQLDHLVPGFTYQQSTYGTPVFTIRGIGLYATSLSVSPTVSVYVDQVPLPYLVMTNGAGLDLERLEVLKGPQGILFGQNSTGGAINYIAAKPTADTHMGFDLSYGRFNQITGEAFASGPLTNTLKARISVRQEYQDGWQSSESRPNDRLGAKDFTATRLLLDWAPSSALKFEFNANGWWNRSETQAAQFEGYVPARAGGYPEAAAALQNRATAPRIARAADWDAGANLRRNDRFHQFSLRGDLDLRDGITLTSITAYSHLDSAVPTDNDGTNFSNFNNNTVGRITSFSQEGRIAGEFGKLLTLTAGGNYQRDVIYEDAQSNFISTNSGIGPFRYRYFINRANQKVSTWAGFASADLHVTETITLQGGLRYTKQDRAFDGCLLDAGDGALARGIAAIPASAGRPYLPAAAGSCVTLDDATLTTLPKVSKTLNEDNLSWRAGINWKPDRNMLFYANVTKGYKAGSFSPLPAVFASQLAPVTQESVLAYEAGFKVDLAPGHVQLAGAGFYYDYRNKQILGYKSFAGLGLNLPALQNIPTSSVYGAELTATVRPMRGLEVSGGATYIHSRVDGSFLAPDPFAKVVDLKGEAFPSTPQWQFIANADYTYPVSQALSAFVGGGITYRSATNAAFGNSPSFAIAGYALLDLRAGVASADGRWRAQVWGKNVTNRYYLLNVAHVTDSIAATVGQPATYGVTLSTRF